MLKRLFALVLALGIAPSLMSYSFQVLNLVNDEILIWPVLKGRLSDLVAVQMPFGNKTAVDVPVGIDYLVFAKGSEYMFVGGALQFLTNPQFDIMVKTKEVLQSAPNSLIVSETTPDLTIGLGKYAGQKINTVAQIKTPLPKSGAEFILMPPLGDANGAPERGKKIVLLSAAEFPAYLSSWVRSIRNGRISPTGTAIYRMLTEQERSYLNALSMYLKSRSLPSSELDALIADFKPR